MPQTGLPESHSEDALIRERGSLPHLHLETVSCAFFLFQCYGHTISFPKSVVYLLVCSRMCQVIGQTGEVGSLLPLLGPGDGTWVTSSGSSAFTSQAISLPSTPHPKEKAYLNND